MAHNKFTQRWVKNLIDSIDARLNEKAKISLMESCGRAWARGGPIPSAEACRGNPTNCCPRWRAG